MKNSMLCDDVNLFWSEEEKKRRVLRLL